MRRRYQVELETRIITPICVEADSMTHAIELARSGYGEAGQCWYADADTPRVKSLGDDNEQ